MIHAYHVIFGAYGFWLPNDPRGSWSDYVAALELFLRAGKTTKVDTRRSLAHEPHDLQKRFEAKEGLLRPPVSFTGEQALAVGQGFAETGYPIHACAIMPEHVHLVLGRVEGRKVEGIVDELKAAAVRRLEAEGFVFPGSPWARGQWKVFLNSNQSIARAIAYVNENPIKEGKPAQRWSFVKPYMYDGWF